MLGEDNPQAFGPRLGEGCSLGLSNGGCWRRACSGRPGRLCDVAMPMCSLQLVRDRSRAEEYLERSLSYLRDAQAPVREAAVRFIGEPPPPVRLWAAWTQPPLLRWQRGASLGLPEPQLPRAGPGPPSAPLPTPVGLGAPCSAPLGCCSSRGSPC